MNMLFVFSMISLVIFQKIKINNNIIINFVFFQSFDLIN